MEVDNELISKVWFFDVKSLNLSDCVKKEFFDLYNNLPYGVNTYFYEYSKYERSYFKEYYPHIINWMDDNIPENENFIIYWDYSE